MTEQLQSESVVDEGVVDESERKLPRDSPNLAAGVILVAVGVLLLVGRLFGISLARFLWPFYIVAPGVLLLIFALTTERSGEGLAIAGSIVTMVGLVLLYQNTTGHWQSWAYAWALVAPTSIGLGQVLYGALKGREHVVQTGLGLVKVGGIIFLVAAVFFELVIGISGFRYIGWPVLLIGLGVILLLRNLMSSRNRV